MSDQKHDGGGPNWLLGLDKLTSPTLDFLGIRLRDKLRAWLNEKARDRAMLRRFEKDFLYRHIDVLNYGNEQFAAMLSGLSTVMLERQVRNVAPLFKYVASECGVPFEKAIDAIANGFNCEFEQPLIGREALLCSAAASTFDTLISFQVAQTLFQFAHAGSAYHLENPKALDEEIERFMEDEATLKSISEAMEDPRDEILKLFLKALCEAYGKSFDEKAFEASVAAAEPKIATGKD